MYTYNKRFRRKTGRKFIDASIYLKAQVRKILSTDDSWGGNRRDFGNLLSVVLFSSDPTSEGSV